jgi:hypothetical protein
MSILAEEAFRASRFLARNIIPNPDFSNGTSGWTFVSGLVANVENNELIITNMGATGPHKVYRNTTSPAGNVKYLAVEMKSSSSADGIRIGNTENSKRHSGSGDWEKLSLVGTGSMAIRILDSSRTGDVSSDPVRIRRVMCLDLTALFGAGREPSREQMDELLGQFSDAWFKGARNLFNAKYFMQMYLAKIRELENAIASIGGS